MTVTPVYDDSEAVELCATYHLYLKPRAKLIISVILPEEQAQCRPVSNWDILEQMKNLVAPHQFSSLRVLKSTKEFMRLEGETDTKQLLQIFLEKLNVQTLQVNNLTDPVRVDVTKEPLGCLAIEEPKEFVSELGDSEDNTLLFGIHLEGLPCKWFSEPSTNVDKPSEEVLRRAFEKYGTIVHIDIPILDPYREDHAKNQVNPCGLQAFDAFVQYENKSSTIDAIRSLQGMKLMYAAEDGKSLACDFKVSLDTTNHFSKEAINKRDAERLHLQELEQQRKEEKEEEERKRKIEERKARAKRRRARLKRRLQRQKREQKIAQQQPACPEDVVEDTEEWEERKLVLAQRRLESLKLLTVLLDKVNDLVQVNKLEEEQANCELETVFSDFSVSSYSENSKVMSPHMTTEERSQHAAEIDGHYELQIKMCKQDAQPHIHVQSDSLSDNIVQNQIYDDDGPLLEHADQSQDALKRYDCRTFKLIHFRDVQSNRPIKRQKIYETDEFIHYLLNYYHYPEYARLFLETNDISIKSECQRVVLWKGDSFQVKLQNLNGHFAEMNFIPELEEKTEDISSISEENDLEPELNLQEIDDCRETSNEPPKSITEVEHEVPLKSLKPHLEKNSQKVYKKSQDVDENSSESNSEIKKVLEEISSTSEYFSEELSGTSSKKANIKRVTRKQRKLKQIKKMKHCSISGHNQLCHHKNLLGHLLKSYCQHYKKHSRCKLPKACQRKPAFHHQCDSETIESDSDTEVEIQRSFKRKKSKINNHSYCPDSKKYNKNLYSSSDSENNVNISLLHNKGIWRPKQNGKPRHKKLKTAHINEKPKRHWSYCFAEDVSDSLEPEESLVIEEETQSSNSVSSSLETAEFDFCSKDSHANYCKWDHSFYTGEQFKS